MNLLTLRSLGTSAASTFQEAPPGGGSAAEPIAGPELESVGIPAWEFLDSELWLLALVGLMLLFLSFTRVRYRSEEFTVNCGLPLRLLLLIVLLAVASIPLQKGWHEVSEALRLGSLFLLALASSQCLSIAIFDLFLSKYRGIQVAKILRDTVVLGIFLLGCFIVLANEGVELKSILATSAVLTMVIGFALQDLLSNIIAGLALQAEQPFKRGDWIGFDGQEGVVLELNWRSTKLMTLHNDVVIIPNSVITRARLINFTAPSPIHRRRFKLGLRYEVPPNQAKASILRALASVNEVLERPQPYVQLLSFDDFAITYRINFYISNFRRREGIEDEVRTRLWYQLKRDGLTIPFPIRDLNVRTVTAETVMAEDRRALDHRIGYLKSVPILAPLSDEELKLLAGRTQQEYFASGETVILEGALGDSMYIIVNGDVEICIGEARRGVAHLGVGSYFGEMSLMTGEKRTATVVASEDCEFIVIRREAFRSILQANDRLIAEIGESLAQRRESLHKKQAEIISGHPSASVGDTPTSLMARIRSFFHTRP